MSALIRDAPVGQIIRYITNNRLLQYPEERPDFEIPAAYNRHTRPEPKRLSTSSIPARANSEPEGPAVEEAVYPDLETVLEKVETASEDERAELETIQTARTQHTIRTQISRVGTRTALQKSISRVDLEQQFSLASVARGPSDRSSQRQWTMITRRIGLLPRRPLFLDRSSCTPWAYIWDLPFTHLACRCTFSLMIPVIGRNPPYIISYAIFVILCVPTSLVDNFAGLIVLRFLQGFFGSPCLATGGASLQDIYSLIKLPYVLSLTNHSGFSVSAKNWRWSLWEMLWMNGNDRLKSQSEIDQANLTPATVYTAIIYGIFYSFFEAFPLVYNTMYGFNLGELGLTFLSVTIGVIISLAWYWWYIYYRVEPEIRAHGLGAPERRLIPALFVTFLVPIGLFIFGWTAREDVHWIVSCIGIVITTIGIFLIIQCIFLYIPLVYPQYAASLFAGNDFARSALAAGSIHFAYPLFHNLGVDRGISLLGGLTVGCSVGVYVLFFFGEKLRAKSRFAAH
ncbi:major facilitator superfamily domain-containing protein [Phaeosphaeriaceae sp. PMI808]|nr:major facilitator superfamily domain-containing protein [Phaeosphaeriaceae sp. PMI808]